MPKMHFVFFHIQRRIKMTKINVSQIFFQVCLKYHLLCTHLFSIVLIYSDLSLCHLQKIGTNFPDNPIYMWACMNIQGVSKFSHMEYKMWYFILKQITFSFSKIASINFCFYLLTSICSSVKATYRTQFC